MENKSESLEMAKALFQFKATIAKTLSFRESDYFIIYQASTKQRNWWQVINSKAQVGYVPSNYVIPVQVVPEFFIKFVDECLTILRKESDKAGGCLPNDRQEVLLKLLERKSQVEKELDSRSVTSMPTDASPCSSVSRISPPLLLNSQNSLKHIHSTSSLPTETRHDVSRKSDTLDRRSLSSICRNSQDTLEKSCSKDGDVSVICGQVGTPLSETQKTTSNIYKKHLDENLSSASTTKLNNIKRESKEFQNSLSLMKLPSLKNDSKENQNNSLSRKSSVSRESKTNQNFESHSRSEEFQCNNSSKISSSLGSKAIDEETVYQLVEKVRCNTGLSHELSRVAADVIVTELQKHMPASEVLEQILVIVQNPLNASKPLIEETHDAKRLRVIFSELTSCKDDAQQRSWMLHEDEHVIIDYVQELTSILMNADSNICKHVISSDQYAGVMALIQYYQMEVRWSIRQPLLQAFGVLCGLDRNIISIFLSSILPMELARDMKTNPRNIPKLNNSALLLTMIFSMSEPMPITHLEHLGTDFIAFLLNNIEDPPDTDVDDQVPDLFITLILSYNLQFKNIEDNVLLKALSRKSVAKTFTEKILLLLNREDDPVRIFDHESAPINSVLKLFIDLFSNAKTAALFYTNDVKVLIDIVVRQLADLSPEDMVNRKRHQYLKLCRVVMRNSGYAEHHHRKDDLAKCFTRIFCEETEISQRDQQLVREISNEFPQYFK